MQVVAEPLSDEELAALAKTAFAGCASVVLAISGGADSLCLLPLAAEHPSPRHGTVKTAHVAVSTTVCQVISATVDHGWRPEAAEEARRVAELAARFSIPHHILTWEGPKPETGRQDAARKARYRLLAELAAKLDLPGPVAIATAHHSDDQAETFLMRLARGSGVDGLAAMAPRRPLRAAGVDRTDLYVIRPFLDVPKARLIATLQARVLSWNEDPSNADRTFERVRIRQALATLCDLGIDAHAIARSASRLTQARVALEAATDTLATDCLELNGGAYAAIAAGPFNAAPPDIQLRLLQRIWPAFSGNGPPRRAQLDVLVQQLAGGAPFTVTLAGAVLARAIDGAISLHRERGRAGLPELVLQAGDTGLWDGRYEIALSRDVQRPITIRALPANSPVPPIPVSHRLPKSAIFTLPAAWAGDTFLGLLHPVFDQVPGITVQFAPAVGTNNHGKNPWDGQRC